MGGTLLHKDPGQMGDWNFKDLWMMDEPSGNCQMTEFISWHVDHLFPLRLVESGPLWKIHFVAKLSLNFNFNFS